MSRAGRKDSLSVPLPVSSEEPPPPQGPRGRRPPPEHRVVVEFELTPLRELESRATVTLGIGFAVSALLMGAAVVFWRLSRRAHSAEVALEKQRGMAALGEMSAVLAHEIKNPLGQAQRSL